MRKTPPELATSVAEQAQRDRVLPVREPDRARSDRRARARFGLAGVLVLALAASAVPGLEPGAALARDAERVRALERVDLALRAYQQETGALPDHVPDVLAGGWETSTDGRFLAVLVAEGYLDAPVLDPVNSREYHLRYHPYPTGTEGAREPFYVLAVTGFESEQPPGVLPARVGERDWAAEYPLALVGP